jgi:hypothetical protein
MLPIPIFDTPGPDVASNWGSFVPDLIVGVFTGLTVGLILAWTQARAAKKKERREIELRWEALRPRVGAELLDPWDRRVIMDSLDEFAHRNDGLLKLVEDIPLASWADVLESDELRSLHEFSKAATELRGASRKFDAFLQHSIAQQLVEDSFTASVADWHKAHDDAALVQPFAMRALFAHPSFPWSPDQFHDIRSSSPIVSRIVARPPVTYDDVLAMVLRAEEHYIECTSIVDAVMTRYWYD